MTVAPAVFAPAVLLAGPRGRRLCLEWARTWSQNDDERLSSAIFYAAHNLDPGRGVSRVLFGVGTDGSDRDADHGSKPPAPGDVARLLADAPLTEPDGPTLMTALAAAVGNARYWEPPDGEDVLAAAPEMRAALARVAHLLAGSPHASWWTTPVGDPAGDPAGGPAGDPAGDTEQWAVEFAGTTIDGEPVRAAAEILPRDARVYEIDGPDAWAYLCRRYPVRVTAARRQVWYQTTGRIGLWVMPDWAGVAQDVDTVHLTVAGYLATAGRAIPVADDFATVLAGWDPDQTYWLTDVDHAPATAQVWHRGESDWSRVVGG